MKAFISGGLGFVGRRIAEHLLDNGYEVTITDLPPRKRLSGNNRFRFIQADTTLAGDWQSYIRDADLIINLAGAPIYGRWTKSFKKRLYDSRILTTRNIVDAIPAVTKAVLFSTSAQGYYGFRDNEIVTESEIPGSDFLARLCVDWEAEALKARDKGARVVLTRFGIVLGKKGGVLGMMIPAFRLFAGGKLGSGNQWFSWIHLEDLVQAYIFLLGLKSVEGPVNFCSPNPVTNNQLTRALARALRRPAIFTTPAFMVKLLLGEFGNTMLHGQRISPEVLTARGFQYRYPDIEKALASII